MIQNRLKRGIKRARSKCLGQTPSSGSERTRRVYDALGYTRDRIGLERDIRTRPGTHCDPELNWLSRMRLVFREPILEFFGVLVMVLLGGSVMAVTYLSDYKDGDWLTICLGWSAAMIFGIYVAGDSGAYLNPAVTLTNCLFRGLPLRRWPTYAISQVAGAFCAHGLVYANYISAIDQYEGHGIRTIPPSSTSTAKIFSTFPEAFAPLGSKFFSEFIANFVTTFLVFAVRDENGADLKGGGFFALAYFWMNFLVIAAFGWETGSPINPARDLTGRTWLAILGYKNAWSAYDYYFWIPVFVPFLACFCGALAYDVFIYTGDSPINNGEWSPTRVWHSIRIDRKMRTKRRQSDEETLDVNGCEQDLESTTTCDRRMSWRSQESRSDTSGWLDRNQSKWSDAQEGPRTAKPGFRQVKWDGLSESDCHSFTLDKVREDDGNAADRLKMKNQVDESVAQEKTYGSLMEKKDKETGYDKPRQPKLNEEGRHEIDEHGNET